MTLEEKLAQLQLRFDKNLAEAQSLEQQIDKLKLQLNKFQQPLLEDQGAIKAIKEMLELTKDKN
jgi:chromosome segregation ATPase